MATLTKKPLQVYLRKDQLDALRGLAQRRSTSLAELVRQAVDQLLDDVPVEDDPALAIVGMFDSGLGDLAQNHDKYLADFETEDNRQ